MSHSKPKKSKYPCLGGKPAEEAPAKEQKLQEELTLLKKINCRMRTFTTTQLTKYNQLQDEYNQLQDKYNKLKDKYNEAQTELGNIFDMHTYQQTKNNLQTAEITKLRAENNQLLAQYKQVIDIMAQLNGMLNNNSTTI